jgi:hypothetical protein
MFQSAACLVPIFRKLGLIARICHVHQNDLPSMRTRFSREGRVRWDQSQMHGVRCGRTSAHGGSNCSTIARSSRRGGATTEKEVGRSAAKATRSRGARDPQ